MAWNGSGTFVRLYNWVADKAASIKIIASRMDGEFDNYKGGLENCLTRDGQTPPTAAIPWNSQKITGLANGTAATDAAAYGQVTGVVTGNAFRRNLLANGGFDVWQSGAGGSATITGTAARVRTADCWWAIRAGTTGYTVSQQTGESNRYALKIQRTAANASTETMNIAQSLETADVVRLKRAVTNLTLSFKAKKGANYSGGNLTYSVVRGTGTDQNVLDTYTGATTLATSSVALTTSLVRTSLAVSTDASTNELGVVFTWTPTGVAGADDSVTFEEVQLEVASAATDFEYLPFAETLRACQRYYAKSFQYTIAPATAVGVTGASALGAFKAGALVSAQTNVTYLVPLRAGATPTITTYNPANANAQAYDLTGAVDCSATTVVSSSSENLFRYTYTGNAATAVGNTILLHWTAADANF